MKSAKYQKIIGHIHAREGQTSRSYKSKRIKRPENSPHYLDPSERTRNRVVPTAGSHGGLPLRVDDSSRSCRRAIPTGQSRILWQKKGRTHRFAQQFNSSTIQQINNHPPFFPSSGGQPPREAYWMYLPSSNGTSLISPKGFSLLSHLMKSLCIHFLKSPWNTPPSG